MVPSELLFASGTDELTSAAHAQLDKLAATLNEVASEIPSDVDWVLRIDGHTDKRPISTPRFPSNWELSAARAASVVHLFMNLGAFYVVLVVGNSCNGEDISDFRGLGTRAPFMAVSMAVFLFALTGIPPFSGFIGKLYLFAEAINRIHHGRSVSKMFKGIDPAYAPPAAPEGLF